jgi:solute carrier family 32 (vesicular inhibitory amino acid transporter)
VLTCKIVVLILLLDGFIKPTSPGSLLEPAATYLFPKNWLTLPLSFGLLMSPWGGHSVFPNVGCPSNGGCSFCSQKYRSTET